MITVSDLKDRTQRKQKEVTDSKAMFDEWGIFKEDNWNGGEGVIRQFTSYLDWECETNQYNKEFYFERDEVSIDGWLISTYSCLDDINYVQITLHYYTCKDEDNCSSWKQDQYLVKWYKNRGKTDVILKNGKPIKIKQYVKLLNIIESTGFKFDMK